MYKSTVIYKLNELEHTKNVIEWLEEYHRKITELKAKRPRQRPAAPLVAAQLGLVQFHYETSGLSVLEIFKYI
jgi:hypothetical protein